MTDISEDLGKCVICGRRVKTDHLYIVTADGYTHRNCLSGSGLTA